MALSGTITGTKTGYFGVEIDWSATQSVANNTSTITIKVYITYAYIDIKARSAGKCKIDDTEYTYSTSAIKDSPGVSYWKLVATKTKTVSHESDGTRKCAISASFPFNLTSSQNGYISTLSAAATVTLDTIARASTITSAANVTLGNSCSVKWTPMSASFRYKLKFSMGSKNYTTGYISPGQATAYTYSGYDLLLDTWAAQITDAKTGTMTVTLYTYPGDSTTQVGDADSATFTVTVPNDSTTQPTVAMTLSPVSALEDTFSGLYIQGKTKVKAALSATGKYGASIESYSMKTEGVSYDSGDSYTSDFLTQYGSVKVYGYAKDSRGFTGSISKSITVISYSKPQILAASGESGVVAARCDADGNLSDAGTYLKIKAKRSYSPVKSGGVQHNFCKIRYRYKADGGSYSSWVTLLEGSDLDSDEIVTGALLGGVLSTQVTYLVQVQAIDDIGENAYTTITISTDKVYMHRDGARNALAIGKYAENDNMVDIAEEITLRTRGPIDAQGGGNVDCLTLGTKITATAAAAVSLNDYKTPGNYYSQNADNSQYITDSPYTAGGFGLRVRELQTTGYLRQELYYGRTTWVRHWDGTTWSDWLRYLTTTEAETAAADFVISTGASGGWTYRKWKGGTYEMFGTFTITPTESTLNGTLYRTNNMTISVPFTISSAYVTGSAVGHYWITNGGISGSGAITLRLMSDKTFSTTTAIEVRLTVVGTYG